MSLRRPRPALHCALSLVWLAAAAAAQEATFGETTDVILVEVPVTVVGRDGEPVRGLAAEDFTVWDGGRRQEIASFEVFTAEVESAAAAAAPPARPAASRPVPAAARRHFLLLFDLSFSDPAAILRAQKAARDFVVGALARDDLAAIAVYSIEHGPRLIVTFTPDRAQLARAIDTLGFHRHAGNAANLDPLRFFVMPPRDARDAGGGRDGGASEMRAEIEQVQLESMQQIAMMVEKEERQFERSRISALARALGEMARRLDSVKGRKQVVYFSEGFDSRLLLGRSSFGEREQETEDADALSGRIWNVDFDKRFGNIGLQSDVEAMLEEFRRADCVIQAVDIGGVRAGAGLGPGHDGGGHDALFFMANETGGELFKDANDLGAQLRRVLRRTSVTYLLAFRPKDLAWDGAYHRLRVEVRGRPGAHVSYRAGYYAPRPFPQLDPLEKSLLASEAIASATPRDDLDLQVLAAPFDAGDQLAYVPVIVEVGGRSLLAGHSGEQLRLEVYGYVTDERGEMRDFFSQTIGLDLGRSRSALLASGVKYYGHLDLGPGRHLVRVLVRNADTGRAGVRSLALEVPRYHPGDPVLLPPFFLEPPGRWLLVRESGGPVEQRSVVYPFTVNGEPYVPAARPPLVPDQAARLCLVAYNLGAGEPRLEGRVTTADGTPVDGGRLALVERTVTGIAGYDKLLASFAPDGLTAGEYRLRIAVTDPATGARKENSIAFTVAN